MRSTGEGREGGGGEEYEQNDQKMHENYKVRIFG